MKILSDYSLKSLNTFGLDANAEYFADIDSAASLQFIFSEPKLAKLPKFVLGGGSNILFTQNVKGLVLKNNFQGISVAGETETQVVVRVGGGVLWHDFVIWCVERNYGGAENLALIPGTVGAAPVQNIGAYGVELKDFFLTLRAIDLETLDEREFLEQDCKFGYRDSIFKNKYKNKWFISHVSFRLEKISLENPYKFKISYGNIRQTLEKLPQGELDIKKVFDAVCQIRQEKLPDPNVLGNAGSFFKNPLVEKGKYEQIKKTYPQVPSYEADCEMLKIPAAWFIDNCGFKGKRVGDVGCYKDQALVIVNYGSARGKEILDFAMRIQNAVLKKFGVELSMEVNVI